MKRHQHPAASACLCLHQTLASALYPVCCSVGGAYRGARRATSDLRRASHPRLPFSTPCSRCVSAWQSARHLTHTPRSRRNSARRMAPPPRASPYLASHSSLQQPNSLISSRFPALAYVERLLVGICFGKANTDSPEPCAGAWRCPWLECFRSPALRSPGSERIKLCQAGVLARGLKEHSRLQRQGAPAEGVYAADSTGVLYLAQCWIRCHCFES